MRTRYPCERVREKTLRINCHELHTDVVRIPLCESVFICDSLHRQIVLSLQRSIQASNTPLECQADGFRSPACLQLLQNVTDVNLNGAFGDAKATPISLLLLPATINRRILRQTPR